MMDLYCVPVANNTSVGGDDHPPKYIVTNNTPVKTKSQRNKKQKQRQKINTNKNNQSRTSTTQKRKSSLLVDYTSSKAKEVGEDIVKERTDLFPETEDVILQLKIESMDDDDDDDSLSDTMANEDSFALDFDDDDADDDDEVSLLGMENDDHHDDDDLSSIGSTTSQHHAASPDESKRSQEVITDVNDDEEGEAATLAGASAGGGAASVGSISFCMRRRSSNKSGVNSFDSDGAKNLSSYDHLQNSLGAMIMAEQEDELNNNNNNNTPPQQPKPLKTTPILEDEEQEPDIVSPSMNRRLQLARAKSRIKDMNGGSNHGCPATPGGRPSPAPTRLLRRARSMRLSDLQLSNHSRDGGSNDENKSPFNNNLNGSRHIRRPIMRSKSLNNPDNNNNNDPLTSSSSHGLEKSFRVMDLLSRSTHHGSGPSGGCSADNNNGGGKSRCTTCRQAMEKAKRSLNDSRNNSMALSQALEETFALHTIKSKAAGDSKEDLPPAPERPISNLPKRTKSNCSAGAAAAAAADAASKNNSNKKSSVVSALLANKPPAFDKEPTRGEGRRTTRPEDRRTALLKNLKNNSDFNESLRSIESSVCMSESKMSHTHGGIGMSARRTSICAPKGSNIRRLNSLDSGSNSSRRSQKITTASALQKSLLMMSTAIYTGDLLKDDDDDDAVLSSQHTHQQLIRNKK